MRRAIVRALLIVIAPSLADRCCYATPSFLPGFQTGTIQNSLITEASGIAASRMNANVLWTHNDSNNGPQVFAMTAAGTNLGTYSLTGATNHDWEDIAVGPGPTAGVQYVYAGDIGDNNWDKASHRTTIAVYRVAEPTVSDTQSPVTTSLSDMSEFTFAYPDGPHDAESMFVDPLTKDIYIITKRDATYKYVYRATYPQSTSGTTTLTLAATLTNSNQLTSADISPDGSEIIIRSYATSSGLLYQRPIGGTITDAFNTTPITIPIHSEGQGEAIGFDPNGRGYFTTSEGSEQPIYYFDLVPPPTGSVYWDNDGAPAGSRVATGAGTGGTGTWNTSAKWYNGSADAPWVDGNNAVFWGTAGTVTLASAQTVNSLAFKTNGYNVTGSTLTLGSSAVSVDSGVTATVSSVVAGSVGLVKSGAGTLRLTQPNTYSGGTTISAGSIFVTNMTGSGTGTGLVSLAIGGVLGGTGAIGGDVNNSGMVKPGDSIGTLHLNGNYTQVSRGQLLIELASAASHDELMVAGNATIAGALSISLVGGFVPQYNDNFEVMTAAGFGGTKFEFRSFPSLPSGLTWKVSYGATAVTLSVVLEGDYNFDGAVDAADYVVWRKGNGTIYTQADYTIWRLRFGNVAPTGAGTSLTSVPEPTIQLMVCMGGVIGLMWGRLRRRMIIAKG
jgi:autotransporter-associated beta strand protein